MNFRDQLRVFGITLFNWEYWPWKVVYIPVLMQYVWHGILAKTFTYPTLINRPYMIYGGIVEESKWEMYLKTPSPLMPQTELFPEYSSPEELIAFLKEKKLDFPLILKPDGGMRGKGIEKVNSLKEILALTVDRQFVYLIQEFMDFPQEVGLFAFKHPKTDKWVVSSIMERGFPTVKGDGKSTLEDLIRKSPRMFLQLKRWKQNEFLDLNQVLALGEEKVIDKIGNHRLGTKFIDKQDKISDALTLAIGDICDQIEGLEYGRLDICFNTWEELEQKKNFSIIEINGANAEPAHIYDPKHSLFYAWKVLFYHFRMQYYIALNARKRGEKPLTHKKARQLVKGYSRTMNDLK